MNDFKLLKTCNYEDLEEMRAIKTEAETYQSEINQETIKNLNTRVELLINKYF